MLTISNWIALAREFANVLSTTVVTAGVAVQAGTGATIDGVVKLVNNEAGVLVIGGSGAGLQAGTLTIVGTGLDAAFGTGRFNIGWAIIVEGRFWITGGMLNVGWLHGGVDAIVGDNDMKFGKVFVIGPHGVLKLDKILTGPDGAKISEVLGGLGAASITLGIGKGKMPGPYFCECVWKNEDENLRELLMFIYIRILLYVHIYKRGNFFY